LDLSCNHALALTVFFSKCLRSVDKYLIKSPKAGHSAPAYPHAMSFEPSIPQPHLPSAGPGYGLWQSCIEQLAQELPEQQFNTWIKPLQAVVADDLSRVVITVGNRFKLDWIRAQYAKRMVALLQQLSGHPVQIDLVIAAKEAPKAAFFNHLILENVPGPEVYGSGLDEPQGGVLRHRLNSALTFDSLVEGTANRMARAAALHVAGMPGHLYNPLFIYGGVGLGKTHLVHAVGNKLLADQPDAKVLYIHAEQFVSDVVKAYQRKTFDEFKERYHSLDLLLIDDVQFFANKERTQEEFFNAFEALLAKKSHIVMTSDTYPKGLADIHERLISRFDSGLTVAIEPPELEMRVAILISKARQEGAEMPEEVAFFVAKNVRSNVRELEGALRKILAYSRFNQKEISITLARDALRDLLSIQNRQISIENIQKTVADYYKIKVADMYSKKRPASIARPRQIAMYLAKELTQKSLPEIGELFGGRDHTTVLHAVRKISAERQQLTELNQQLHVLEQTLKG
jgi:chromosomal replication initiator protein